MRTITRIIVLLCCLSMTVAEVEAANTIYLPHVSQGPTTAAPEHFAMEWSRLWSIWENGGQRHPLVCGSGRTLQVDVFDAQGEGSTVKGTINGRLNGVQVQVTHLGDAGSSWIETKHTGAGFDNGVALFDLTTNATVQIIADADGRAVSSPPVSIATNLAEIPREKLIGAGYCTDDASCQALIEAGHCNGTVSWGVVFKRTF